MEHKSPFTPAGVDQRIAHIYAQDDASVEQEALAVETDLFAWMQDNFLLDPSQVAYMLSLGEGFAQSVGQQLAFSFRHRLAVTMTKGDVQQRGYKFIRPKQEVTTTYAPDQEPTISGGLHFYIS